MVNEQINERLSAPFNTEAFYTNYRHTFSLVRADTAELREDCYRLRYDVYVEENGFIPVPSDHETLEYDHYDDRAIHFLLMHNQSGRSVGTIRVLLPNDSAPHDSFSMQDHCDHPILHDAQRVQTFCQLSLIHI